MAFMSSLGDVCVYIYIGIYVSSLENYVRDYQFSGGFVEKYLWNPINWLPKTRSRMIEELAGLWGEYC